MRYNLFAIRAKQQQVFFLVTLHQHQPSPRIQYQRFLDRQAFGFPRPLLHREQEFFRPVFFEEQMGAQHQPTHESKCQKAMDECGEFHLLLRIGFAIGHIGGKLAVQAFDFAFDGRALFQQACLQHIQLFH